MLGGRRGRSGRSPPMLADYAEGVLSLILPGLTTKPPGPPISNIAQFDIGIRAMAYYSRYNSTIDVYISKGDERDGLMG